MIVFTLPIHLRSVANAREHWAVKARFAKAERGTARLAGIACRIGDLKGPLVVTVTRISPRALDSHDNLRAAAKACVDGLADALGLKSDRDARVEWRYAQEKGKPSAVRVEIQEAES